MDKVKFQYWIQAARPKTLLVSIAPVVMSLALASIHNIINWLPAIISLIFAVMAQILSNFINDYSDGIKGADDERLGPQRMVASGLISPQKMFQVIIAWGVFTFLLGCTLLYWGGWILLPFGIVILLCALAYSAGPFPLSRHALGDVAVVLFYGIAPVVLTFFIQTGFINYQIIIAGIAIGIVANNLLIVNNYRDAEQDEKNGKKTTVTILGRRVMKGVYYLNPLIAIVLMCFILSTTVLLYLIPFLIYSTFVDIRFSKCNGSELNKLIGMSSLEAIIFALSITLYVL